MSRFLPGPMKNTLVGSFAPDGAGDPCEGGGRAQRTFGRPLLPQPISHGDGELELLFTMDFQGFVAGLPGRHPGVEKSVPQKLVARVESE
jgi:hypothetical protein